MVVLTNAKVEKKSFDVIGDNLVTVTIQNIIEENEEDAKIEYTKIIDILATYNTKFTAILPDGRLITLRIDNVETDPSDITVFDNEDE